MSDMQLLRMEREHLFAPDAIIDMLVELNAPPDITRLIQAIDSAVKANESLNCQIVLSEDGTAGYQRRESPRYSVKTDSRNWKEIIREQEKREFAIEAGEMIRFFILDSGCSLLILAHHFAGDGLSLIYLIEDIFRALSGNPLTFKPLNVLCPEDLPPTSALHPLTRLLVNRLNRNWGRDGRAFTFDEHHELFRSYWSRHTTRIFSDELTREEYARLRKASDQAGVSLNSWLTTAMIRTFGKRADTGMAVNVREKGSRGMANYASGIAISYRYDEHQPFAENARRVHRRIHKKLKDDRMRFLVLQFLGQVEPTLIDSACMTSYAGYHNRTADYFTHLIQYDNRPKDISITNLTKLPIACAYGPYAIRQIYFAGPVIPNARRVFGIATLEDNLTVTMHVPEDERLQEEADYFAKVMQTLRIG